MSSDRKKTPLKIASYFALLDVTKGRQRLSRHFSGRPYFEPCPVEMRVPVVITGYIDGQHSRDDGTSIEFYVSVQSVKVGGNEQ